MRYVIFFCLTALAICPDTFPQKDYFQQEVNFSIKVVLNEKNNTLNAFEQIEYINNSPDTLEVLYFHLWPNGYSSNSTALAKQIFAIQGKQKLFRDTEQQGYIDSLEFQIDGVTSTWSLLPGHPDICRIELPDAVLPGDTIHISTPFHVKMPRGNISRMGYNDDIFQVSQWYPKPAVYDRNGWHPMPYLDQGEYYSEFGTFNVEITLPSDYVVAASGELLTESESEWMSTVASDWRTIPAATGLKTVSYRGAGIHDFAWVASQRFRVVTDTIILPGSGRRVIARTVFTARQAHRWLEAMVYLKRAVLRFSEWIGDYPYGSITMVQASLAAGSGMEYPGLAVIGPASDAYSLDEVIAHETVHNWFYGALGSDERRFPFIDEGLATSYANRYMELYYPGKKMWELYFRNERMARFYNIEQLPAESLSEIQWLISARDNLEQPLDLHSTQYTSDSYGDLVYYKAGQSFTWLRAWLGNEVFDMAMARFFSDWKGKHPSPEDLRESLESSVKRDLSWFFEDVTGTTRQFDYKLKRIRGDSLLVMNQGILDAPFPVTGLIGDSVVFTRWYDGFTGSKWFPLPKTAIHEIRLNKNHIIPETDHLDNNLRSSGLFPGRDPLRPQISVLIEDPGKRTLVVVPLVNWTRADGFMAGFAMNNGTMLQKKLNYSFAPFYEFRNPELNGKAGFSLNFIPYNIFVRKLSLVLEGAKFGISENNDYFVVRTGFDLWLRKPAITMESSMFYGRYISATDLLSVSTSDARGKIENFFRFGYVFERKTAVNPFSAEISAETNGNYLKTGFELKKLISYYGRNRGLSARLYSGYIFAQDPLRPFYSLAPSGRSGRENYMFDGDFPDRFSSFPGGFWSRQMVISEGGLVTAINDSTGFSPWLVSLSMSSTLPGKAAMLPVKPFMNFLYNGRGPDRFFYEAGIMAGIGSIFEIYLPLAVSDNISSVRKTVRERVRFSLDLGKILKLRIR